jgi:O-antigen/teichoic acid export membrane protein
VAVVVQRLPGIAFWHQVRRVSSRLSWGVADQGASSLTNFLLNILVARTLGAEQFGAFTLAYVTYGFALNASRGVSIEPLLVRFSVTDMKTWRRATSRSTGTALLVGLVLGTLALAAAIVMGGTTGKAFLGLGLMLPGLLLQDSWRYAFFAARNGHHALINDVLWAVVEIPVLLVLKATGHVNVFWFVIAWGAGANAGAVFGAFQARTVPRLHGALSWLIAHRDLGPRFLVENCGGNGASTLQSYTISSFLGLESVGYMQAANVLMGPFRILSFGIGMMTIPEGAALMRRAPRKALRFCVALSIGQTLLAAVWTVALLVALPLGFGQLVLGGLWEGTYPLVVPTALTVIAGCAGSGAGTGLHAMGAAKLSMRLMLACSVIGLSAAVAGSLLGSILITLYLIAAVSCFGAVLYWWQFLRAMHESGTIRAGGQHHQPSTVHRPAKNPGDSPVTAVAVSRPVPAGSYVRETPQGLPQAARPGKEMS